MVGFQVKCFLLSFLTVYKIACSGSLSIFNVPIETGEQTIRLHSKVCFCFKLLFWAQGTEITLADSLACEILLTIIVQLIPFTSPEGIKIIVMELICTICPYATLHHLKSPSHPTSLHRPYPSHQAADRNCTHLNSPWARYRLSA